AQEQFGRLGSLNIIVKTVKPPEEQDASEQSESMVEYGVTYADAERFRNSIPGVEVIVPNRRISQRAWYRNRKVAVEVIGTVPWLPEASPIQLQRGRFLSSIDMDHKQGICVVDERIVEALFTFDDPLGQDVKIASDYYRVVGIVSAESPVPATRGSENGVARVQSQGGANVGSIYVPLTAVKDRFGEITIQISGESGGNIEKVELQEIIIKVGAMDNVLPTRDIVDTLLSRFHEKNDYQIVVPLELLRQAKRTQRIFSIVLGSIAAISLLVGGIGIMNIM
ncbi:unnamed protein product, partial [marine sediment metagenome]